MSADEFWRDDPQLFVSYRTSFINKKKREMDEIDYKCWLQGLYIYDGNGKLTASLKKFFTNLVAKIFKGTKDNQKIESYPKKPFFELDKERRNKEKKEQKERNKKYQNFESSLEYYGTMKQRYLENIKKRKKKGE